MPRDRCYACPGTPAWRLKVPELGLDLLGCVVHGEPWAVAKATIGDPWTGDHFADYRCITEGPHVDGLVTLELEELPAPVLAIGGATR